MKKVLGILLCLAVLCVSACSEVEEPEQSSLVKDLELVATKAMSATLQPYWDKSTIEPVFPITPHVDSLSDGNSTGGVTPDTYTVDLVGGVAEIDEVVAELGIVEEMNQELSEYLAVKFADSDIDMNSYIEVAYGDTLILIDELMYAVATDEYQTLYDEILDPEKENPTISDIAENESLLLYEKISLAAALGIAENHDYLELLNEIDTKGRKIVYACDDAKIRRDNRCKRDRNISLGYMWACSVAIGAIGIITTGGWAVAAWVVNAVYDGVSTFWLSGKIEEAYQTCLLNSRQAYQRCNGPKSGRV